MIKDIIKEFRRVRASELQANPRNWRRHPKAQREAMEGILAEIGFAGAVLAYETDTGLELIDGHLRTEIAADEEVPVLILDTDEAGAAKILATFDPISAMAEADAQALGNLLGEIQTENQAVADMLTRLAEDEKVYEVPQDPPEDFQEVGEDIETNCECPKCGYKWSNGK